MALDRDFRWRTVTCCGTSGPGVGGRRQGDQRQRPSSSRHVSSWRRPTTRSTRRSGCARRSASGSGRVLPATVGRGADGSARPRARTHPGDVAERIAVIERAVARAMTRLPWPGPTATCGSPRSTRTPGRSRASSATPASTCRTRWRASWRPSTTLERPPVVINGGSYVDGGMRSWPRNDVDLDHRMRGRGRG